jgi:hypothetical protein
MTTQKTKYINFYDFLKEQNAEYEIPIDEKINVSTKIDEDENS